MIRIFPHQMEAEPRRTHWSLRLEWPKGGMNYVSFKAAPEGETPPERPAPPTMKSPDEMSEEDKARQPKPRPKSKAKPKKKAK